MAIVKHAPTPEPLAFCGTSQRDSEQGWASTAMMPMSGEWQLVEHRSSACPGLDQSLSWELEGA